MLNTEKYEISDTYYFSQDGNNAEVFATHVFDGDINHWADEFLANKIFVATSLGLFYANKHGQLHVPDEWRNDSRLIGGFYFGGFEYTIILAIKHCIKRIKICSRLISLSKVYKNQKIP